MYCFYILETRVGPIDSTLEGVKLGITKQEMWGRLRAYHQAGVLYKACAWKGNAADIHFLEARAKKDFAAYNMRTQFETCATEVFIGKKASFVYEIEQIIAYAQLDVQYVLEDYGAFNITKHETHVAEAKPFTLLNCNTEPLIPIFRTNPQSDTTFNLLFG